MDLRRARTAAFAAVLVAFAGALIAGCGSTPGTPRVVSPGGADTRTADASWAPSVTLIPRWSGFTKPVQLVGAGDGSGRRFVVELGGVIRLIAGGKLVDRPFLDISDKVSTGGERGLLSMAFAPDHATSGRFYVDYTDRDGNTVIERYRVSADDRNVAAPESARVILTVVQPYANHNGGQIAFGPDRMLYIGMGDGGGAGDPQGNGQRTDTLLGKILRIDVSGDGPYTVPPTNPFARRAGYRPEIWDLGLRNPWRFSFDSITGELLIADVGQHRWEEIDVEPAGAGGRNYGWNLYEGAHAYPPGSAAPASAGLTMPIIEYGHDLGYSITGGFVYRGVTWKRLAGIYFYADYGSGRMWAASRDAGRWRTAPVAETGRRIAGFGQDDDGELFALDLSSGEILGIQGP